MKNYTVKYTASIDHHQISSKAKEYTGRSGDSREVRIVHVQVRCRIRAPLPDDGSMKILEEVKG
jgi:hypothetical protein